MALGPLGCPLDGLSCSQNKNIGGSGDFGLFLEDYGGRSWAKTAKIHISGTTHGRDLVDPSL